MPAAFLSALRVVAGCPGLHWLDDGLNENATHGFLLGQQPCRKDGLGAGQEVERQCLPWSNNGVGLTSPSDEYLA